MKAVKTARIFPYYVESLEGSLMMDTVRNRHECFRSAIIAVSVLIFIFASLSGCSKPENPPMSEKARILNVNDVVADPQAFKGEVKITGVVADKSRYMLKDSEAMILVDTREAKRCKQTGCASRILVVKYGGDHPKEWDEVNITGSFREGSPEFLAKSVKILGHLSL